MNNGLKTPPEGNGSGVAEKASSDTMVLAKGAGVNFLGQLVSTSMQFLTHVTLARLLGPGEYGLYALGWTLLRMSRLVSGLGLDKGVIRFGARYHPDDPATLRGVIRQSITMSIISGLIFSAALFALAPLIAKGAFGKPELGLIIRYFALCLTLVCGLRVTSATARITHKMHYSVRVENILQPVLNVLLILILVGSLDMGLEGALLALGLSYAAALSAALLQLKWIYPDSLGRRIASPNLAIPILLFSLPASAAGMLSRLNTWLDRLMVGHYLTVADTGIYVAASQISNMFLVLSAMFNIIFGTLVASLFAQGELKRLEATYRVSTKWALYISMAVFLVIVFAPEAIMKTAFGARYTAGTGAMLILVTAHLVMVVPGPVSGLLVMSGNQNRWLALTALTVVVNTVLNILFIPRWGIEGAALATGGAMAAMLLGGLALVRIRLKMWPFDRRYFKGLLAALATVAVLLLWSLTPRRGALLNLMVTGMLTLTVFGGVLALLGFDDEDRTVMERVKVRLRRTGIAADLDDSL